MKQLFDFDDMVKIASWADFKYNNERAGSSGRIFDVFYSDGHGTYVYEVELTQSGRFQLFHSDDLVKNNE